MSTIIFKCDVTEFDVIPPENNDTIAFAINKRCLVINIMTGSSETPLIQTEIDKESAIELAKLILFKYR